MLLASAALHGLAVNGISSDMQHAAQGYGNKDENLAIDALSLETTSTTATRTQDQN